MTGVQTCALPISSSGTGSVSVGAGLILSSSTTYTFTAAITFTATSSSYNVTCNGVTFSGTFTFNGAGGTWSTTDILRCTGGLNLTAGTLNLVYDVYAGTISSSNSNVRALNFGTSSNIVNLYLTGTGTLATFSTTTNLSIFAAFNCYVTDSSASAKTLTYNTVFQNNNNVFIINLLPKELELPINIIGNRDSLYMDAHYVLQNLKCKEKATKIYAPAPPRPHNYNECKIGRAHV